jgi:hypothetical protein
VSGAVRQLTFDLPLFHLFIVSPIVLFLLAQVRLLYVTLQSEVKAGCLRYCSGTLC